MTALIHQFKSALRRSGVTRLTDPNGKAEFVKGCPPGAHLLDVGCGSNSPFLIKSTRPDLHYIGLDVGNYRQTGEAIAAANEYILATPEGFADAITEIATRHGGLDAVISSHNLEHCLDPIAVLSAMLGALKPGGRLYLSFPSEASVNFPSRTNTLNFFDDPTHRAVPEFDAVVAQIRARNFSTPVIRRRYRPALYFLLGLAVEPVSALRRKIMRGTWALYGFESIIWAKNTAPSHP